VRGLLVRTLFWYSWRSAIDDLIHSERGPVEQRARRIVTGTFVLGCGVAVAAFLPYALWIVTGRGPYRWLGAHRHRVIIARRHPRGFPEDVMEAIRSGWAFPFPSIPDE
jgi:hypothetical protein